MSVGTALANLLRKMMDKKKVKLEKLVLIGFSLGAHVSSFVGRVTPGLPKIIGN